MSLLLRNILPADEWKAEQEKVAKRKPLLAFARAEPTPLPVATPPPRDPFAWLDVADLLPVEPEQ